MSGCALTLLIDWVVDPSYCGRILLLTEMKPKSLNSFKESILDTPYPYVLELKIGIRNKIDTKNIIIK